MLQPSAADCMRTPWYFKYRRRHQSCDQRATTTPTTTDTKRKMLRFLAVASLAAAQICPESQPHECSAPTTNSYGPCCDVSADCKCKPANKVQEGDNIFGHFGASYLPRTQSIGDPDASTAVKSAVGVAVGGSLRLRAQGPRRMPGTFRSCLVAAKAP